MVIFKAILPLQKYLHSQRLQGTQVGFVPTMGALHAGHISLIDRAKNDGKCVVCSIFLNPKQFNDKNDFDKYPVSTEDDIALLVKTGCDILFLPATEEIYPPGIEVKVYDFGYLDTILEGGKRPGHFRGVGQVVGRLLEIVNPGTLYLGQKDYQQCMVIYKLKEMMGLYSLEVVIAPTLREEDGLAMSSRNRRLTHPARATAALLYQCLVSIQAKQGSTPFSIVKKECLELLECKGFETEYVALAAAAGLTLLDDYMPGVATVALIAAKIGEIRLIDNILLEQ